MSLQTVDALECLFVLKENEDDGGHTWMSRANIPCRDATLQFLQSMEKVYIHGKRVFRMTTYEDEGYIATFVNERRDASPCFSTPSDTKGDLTEEQQQAVANAFRHRVSLITGGPGTGKTHTIKGMLNYLESISQLGGNVALLAPTGKAVSRIMTMLNKDDYSQYNIQTSTIHRFMYQDMVEYNDEGVTFIVIDEMSMVDVPTFARLLRFIHTHHEHAHIVLVGDPDQLPSIGCGNILADIISSDALPHVQLTKVQRQEEGGDLLAAIYTVKGGAAPRFRKDSPDFIYGGDDPVSYIENIAAEYRDRPQDLLIITPRNYVIRQLQPRVRAIMNPNASSEGLCQGDRVIQKVNTYETMTEQPRFNGMIGTVQDIQISTTTVTECVAGQKIQRELDLSKIYVAFDHFDAEHILTQQESKDELDFAYILTVHKSQGSQAHTVVVLVDDESSFFLTRNLIYTAISRAEKKCIVVGSIEAYVDAIKRESPKRRTCLANWLRV
jgi:exodeoxyribonuclease V alpha subunit